MLNILSNADTVLLNTLSGQDNTTIHPSINNLIDMNTSIGNTGISNTTTEADSNGKLYKIFKNLYTYESTISTILCTKIAKYLLKNILHATAFYNFPKDLFHGVFLEFVLKQNLFYNKQQIGIYRTCVFEKIMSSESNYFNLNFDILCIQNYISHARNLRSFINTQSMTYVILSNYEITIVLNFLDLINEVYRDDIADTEDTEDLQFEGFELYKLIYSSLANMLLLNLESSRLYDLTYMVQNYMDLSGTTIYYRNIINTLKEMEELKQLLLIYITDIDVNTATSEQIHLVAYSRNEETHIFDAYLHHKTIFKPVLVNLFKSERINIHDKCKLILTITDFEEDFIPELIRFFINLEDYNESGLKIKLKIRSKILKYTGVLIIPVLPGEPPDNNKLLDYTNEIFTDNFMTLYTNHIINITEILENLIREFTYYPIDTNRIAVIKYVNFLSVAIDYNENLFALFKNQPDNLYYFKTIETVYSFLDSIIKQKLYTFIQISSTVDIYISNVMSDLFINFFQNLQILSNNEHFIETWANNDFFYNEKTFQESIHCYGYFEILKGETVKIILDSISTKINLNLAQISKMEKTYSEPIPEKFHDPIMLSIIKKPLEIPSVKIIVDRYTIYNHLFFNKTNPYTNEPLTVYELEEYNKATDTVRRVSEFIRSFEEWKLLHQIK